MRLFYIAPWPAADPLTISTVVPHLLALAQDPCLAELTFFSCEKECDHRSINHNLTQPIPTHIHHRPLTGPSASSLPLVRRIQHHRHLSAKLIQSARQQKPNLVICRGTTGVFGDLLQRHLGIPNGHLAPLGSKIPCTASLGRTGEAKCFGFNHRESWLCTPLA